jgi:hypothetical protein
MRNLMVYDGEGNSIDTSVIREKTPILGTATRTLPVSTPITTRILTEEGIQEFIKSRIPAGALRNFLRRAMVDDKIDGFSQLLNYESFESRIPAVPDVPVNSFYNFVRLYVDTIPGTIDALGSITPEYIVQQNKYVKYAFDLILVILYEELASISDIISIASSKGKDALLIFEKMVVLEFDLYVLEASVSGATDFSEKDHIIDEIPSLFHGTREFLSYKDIANVTEQISQIYSDSLSESGLSSLPTILSGVSFITGVSSSNRAALARINGLSADAEGSQIALYSFLINYNVANNSFIKKHKALYTSNDGYYVKKAVSSTGVITSETIYLGVSAPSGLRLTQFLHYGKYSTLSEVTDYKNARNLLLEFRRQMFERTINY